MKSFMRLAAIFLIIFVSFSLVPMLSEASSPPPMPTVYSGSITVGGTIPSDSVTRISGIRNECVTNCVTVKIGDFVSDGGIVVGGRYSVTVGPPNSSYVSSEVKFFYDDLVIADQTDRFVISASFRMVPNFNLIFPNLPTPTPVPTATPTVTPIPTPTPVPSPTPVPTATSIVTPTPANLRPMVFSGTIKYVGGEGDVFRNKELFGRVGSYISEPVPVVSISGPGNLGIFDDLILNATNRKFLGKEIHFDFGGIVATLKHSINFLEGGGEFEIELEVKDDTPTEVPPTSTTVPSRATEIPATATSVPPTVTAVPPVATMVPTVAAPTPRPPTAGPTAAPPVPTVNVLSPEATAQPEDETWGCKAGGCNNPAPVSKLTGAANALMLFGPLLLVGGYRGWRRRNRE